MASEATVAVEGRASRLLRLRQVDLRPGRRVWFPIAALACWLFVLAVHGFVPGSSQVPLTALFGTGIIQCLHDQGIASLWTWCMSLGLPVGAPRLTGLPQVYTGWAVSFLPGVDAWSAHQLSQAAYDTLAFAGSYLLLRRWEVVRVIALLGTVSYLTAPNVLILNGFPYTMLGYLLLPAFALATLRSLDWFAGGRWIRGTFLAATASVFLAFTDGYAYFGGVLISGLLALAWAIRRFRNAGWGFALSGLGVWMASLAGAGLLYAVSVPGDAYATEVPLEYFGLLAVDVVTLFVPSVYFLYPRLLGFDPPVLNIWGITDTLPTNYLGYLAIALVVLYFVLGRRSVPQKRSEILALVWAGAAALILSLGPTLKIGQIEPGLSQSLLTLPTSWIHENVPGISEMRATNRWLIVTRLAIVAPAAMGLSLLWQRSKRRGPWACTAVVVLGMLALIETAPNLWLVSNERHESIEKVQYLRNGIVAEAEQLIDEDEVVLVLPSVNDFLAMYLVPMAGAQSYNVGGDKNYYLSLAAWPDGVLAARDNYGVEGAGHFCLALEHTLDAIVLPYMSPYFGPLLVQQDGAAEAERERVASALARDPRFTAEVGEWMTVLRSSGRECLPAS